MIQFKNHRIVKIAGLLLCMFAWLANSSNPPTGRTGAPFDGNCSNCHGGNNPNGYGGTITITGPTSPITPGQVYPITVTMTTTAANSPARGGFQLVVVDGANNNAGTLANIAGQGTGIEATGARSYMEHRNPKNFAGANSSISWDFEWTAPASASGNTIKMYFIGLFGDGGSSSGDFPLAALETFTFTAPPPPTATVSGINVLCFGGNTGSANVDATGGTPPYTYFWNNGQTGETANNLTAGTYTVTVTGGGTVTASVVITQPPALTATASASNPLNCNNASADITATSGGGTPGYSFAWSGGNGNGNPITVTQLGTYTVTVTDANGCTRTASATVTGNLQVPNAVATGNTITCQTSGSVLVSGQGSSTGAAFTYSWTASNGGTISGPSNGINIQASSAGSYTLVVTNTTNGCTNSATASVTNTSTPPTVVATGGTVSCSNLFPFTVSGQGSSVGNNFTYLWTASNGGVISGPANTLNIQVTAAGTYSLLVTNTSNGCNATSSATVTVNPSLPPLTTTGGTLTCFAPSVVISASVNAAVTYAWSGPNNFTSTLQNPTVSAAGTYTVTVTGTANGCTGTATATAVVNSNQAAPNVSVTNATLTCTNTSATITASSTTPGIVFSWPNGSNNASQVVTASGIYVVVATAPNGCTSTAASTVNIDVVIPNVSVTNATITCTNPTVTITASSTTVGATYVWPNGSTTASIQVSTPGSYTVTATGTNGCTATTSAVVNTNNQIPTVNTTGGILTCTTPSIQISASANVNLPTYAWSGSGIIGGQNTATPTVNLPNIYTVTVTNTANGCTNSATATVTQSPSVSASITPNAQIICFGGTNGALTANYTGGTAPVSYLWSTTATTQSINNLASGTYSVAITDAAGCTGSASVTLTQPTAVVANVTSTNTTGGGLTDGTAAAAPTGGTAPYTYLWSNSATTQAIANLAPGTYTVTVTDNNQCTSVGSANVNNFNCTFAPTSISTNITCNGAGNGTAAINLGASVTPPVVYQWSNNATTQTLSNLVPGNYTVTVTDATNCPVILSVAITQPDVLVAIATATGETSVGANNGTAQVMNVTGGTAPYTYLWSNQATTALINNLAPATYTVTVTDSKGCTTVTSTTVSPFGCTLTGAISGGNLLVCAGTPVLLTAAGLLGTTPYTYIWNTTATTESIVVTISGTYTVTVTDQASCTATATKVVTVYDPLVAEVVSVTNPPCPNVPTGAALIGVSGGGTAPYTFTANNNGAGLPAGNYTITVTNPNGCTTTVSFVISAVDNVAPTITCPADLVQCEDGFPINFTLPQATDNCINQPSVSFVSGLPNGSAFPIGTTTQVYRATDGSGNSSTCSFNITVHPLPDLSSSVWTDDLNGAGIGSISVTPVGGTPPYSFEWRKGGILFATTEDLTNLTAGVYILTLKDANGCETTLSAITIDNVVSTSDLQNNASLQVVPNPAADYIVLVIKGINPILGDVNDQYGRLVQVLQPGMWQEPIELSNLPAGLYILRLQDEGGRWYRTRFVKN